MSWMATGSESWQQSELTQVEEEAGQLKQSRCKLWPWENQKSCRLPDKRRRIGAQKNYWRQGHACVKSDARPRNVMQQLVAARVEVSRSRAAEWSSRSTAAAAEGDSMRGSGSENVVGGELGANSLSVETETLDVQRRGGDEVRCPRCREPAKTKLECDNWLGDWATTELEPEPEALSTPSVQQPGQHSKPVRVLLVKQKFIGRNKMECDTKQRTRHRDDDVATKDSGRR